jgi:hypothetical protein
LETEKTAYEELHNLYFKYYYGTLLQGHGLDSSGLGQGSIICSFENGREFLDQLIIYYLLNKDSAPRGLLYTILSA